MPLRPLSFILFIASFALGLASTYLKASSESLFADFLKPVFKENCVQCHGKEGKATFPRDPKWLAKGDIFASRLKTLLHKELEKQDMLPGSEISRLWKIDRNCDVENCYSPLRCVEVSSLRSSVRQRRKRHQIPREVFVQRSHIRFAA